MAEKTIQCFQCGTDRTVVDSVGFSDTCDKCQAYLHSCGNCRHWVKQRCTEPHGKPTPDASARNLCDWYMPRLKEEAASAGDGDKNAESAKDKFDKLFGGSGSAPAAKKKNLFGDD